MNAPNFQVVMLAKGKARVEIYDVIGPSWAGMIDTKLVSKQLKDAGELSEIEVRINSPGGNAFDGLAIHNVLKDHPARVTVVIDGVAASAASLIAMAGDTVRIPANAMMMLHEPSTFAFGTKADMKKVIEALDSVTAAGIATYAAKSKQPNDKVAKWLKDETWFTGQEAVDAGLADTTEKEISPAKAPTKASVQQLLTDAQNQFSSLYAVSMRATQEKPDMADTTTTVTPAPAAKSDPPPVALVVPAAPQLTAADVNIAVQKALTEERTRTSAIMAICQRAGKPDLANEYIAANLTVADVNAKMVEVLCKDRPPVGDAGGNDAPATKDEDAALKSEYDKDRVTLSFAGVSEADYVMSRRISEGREPLLVRK